jgi:YD repeat-containing protein
MTNMVDAVGSTRFSYDAASQLLSEDGPWADDQISFDYTSRLRTGLNLAVPNATPWSVAYTYDGAKRLTNVSSPAGTFGYKHDTLARLNTQLLSLAKQAAWTSFWNGCLQLPSAGNVTLKNVTPIKMIPTMTSSTTK